MFHLCPRNRKHQSQHSSSGTHPANCAHALNDGEVHLDNDPCAHLGPYSPGDQLARPAPNTPPCSNPGEDANSVRHAFSPQTFWRKCLPHPRVTTFSFLPQTCLSRGASCRLCRGPVHTALASCVVQLLCWSCEVVKQCDGLWLPSRAADECRSVSRELLPICEEVLNHIVVTLM